MKKFWPLLAALLALSLCLYPFYYKYQLENIPELKKTYPSLALSPGIILLIFAHSDDEIGIMAQVAELRRKNPENIIKWVIVSDGARGFVFWGSCGDLTKAECRLKEASAVADCAGIAHPRSLKLPDGKVSETKELDQFLIKHIPDLMNPNLRAVFTHDKRGLYGHPDHVAVYDAVSKILSDKQVPLISMALPELFKHPRIMMEPAKGRVPEEITHILELAPDLLKVKSCVARAHQSQKLILNLLMFKGLSAETFFESAPREFLNSSLIPRNRQAPSSYE